jgi:DNA ligase-1
MVAAFPAGALLEDKFDGIRAQVHKRGSQVEIYSRTLDRVIEFPELIEPIGRIPGEFILDGEIYRLARWKGDSIHIAAAAAWP